ncbi:GtrA family protein [Natronincola ferrireducens]|uniref:Putative flippase GtrA (Transmembrane translocase of bactoprenol-linked glucose) n=1 Tax=Natronincola ferrireducens TaxID=393762 RepID=A0A1G8X4S7_9FIRM|nr:GtrA family protein [Natronincola ferrireducens]SDJ84825.1 Putative flippase GtrA (transmembrane translocase of bactoprenol-linked glucose) [Natronincola ferrireducens]
MIDKAYIKRRFIQHLNFIKFCMVGGTNTLVSLVIYWILLKADVYYLAASTLAYGAGIVNGYLLSTAFVFKRSREARSFMKFFLVYFSSMIINLIIMYVAVDHLLINKVLAQFIAIGFNMIYNYSLNKIWTFK